LTRNIGIGLPDINFNAFTPEDVDTMRKLYSDVLEHNEYKTERLACALHNMPATVAAAAFV
jgi:hypothetical protein